MERLDLGIVDRQRDQDHVEVAAEELPHQRLGDGLAEMQGEVGETPLQLGQRRRQEIRRDRRDGAELERSRQHPLAMLGVVEQIAHRGKDGAPAPDDLLALLGQLDPRLSPLDQADLELVLHLLDLHAESRLGDGASLRRLAEMQRLRQGLEITQLAKRHHSR